MRYIVGLAMAAVLALALSTTGPATVEAGSCCGECPPNYQLVDTASFANHPLQRRADRADKNEDDRVCFKREGQGPLFVDNIPF
jgi:hypothetical protein